MDDAATSEARAENGAGGRRRARLIWCAVTAAFILAGAGLAWWQWDRAQYRGPRGMVRAILDTQASGPRTARVTIGAREVHFAAGPQWDRAQAITLAVLDASPGGAPPALSPAERIRSLLKINRENAEVVGLILRGRSPTPPAPAPEVARAAAAWPEAREVLVSDHGLNSRDMASLRAALCQETLDIAFDSKGALKRAQEALAKYVELTPAQVETVLAMAAARRLLSTCECEEINGALQAISQREPGIASILASARHRWEPR